MGGFAEFMGGFVVGIDDEQTDLRHSVAMVLNSASGPRDDECTEGC